MTNVIAMRTSMPMHRRTNLRIVKSQKAKIDFYLLNWFKKIYQNYCRLVNDIKLRKIKALKNAAYKYYLDFYLTHTKGTVDIHEALYREGIAVCQFAEDMAEMIVMQRVKEGKLDDCYNALKKMERDRATSK